jgi:putative aldouronate transport system substrate-binding protein
MQKKINFCPVFPLMLAALASLFGCGGSAGSSILTLIWWQIGSNSADLAHYSQILSDYTQEKIGVRMDLRQGTWANATQRFNAMINTGEYWDILFSDANTYPSFASLGAYADITALVKEAAPDLYNGIPEELWRGVSLNGIIYGVPTYKDSASTMYAFWDAAVVDKYQLNIEDNSWRNLDFNFRKIKVGEGQRYYPYIMAKGEVGAVFLRYDTFTSFLHPIGVRSDDPERRVVCTLEQADVLEAFDYMHHWYETGIINPDANMVDNLPKYRPYFIAQAWPAVAASYATSAGIEKYLPSKFYGPIHSTQSIQGSINCISVNSKYKKESLKLLQLVNSDPKFRDMMAYGVEGDHFHYVTMPDGRKAVHRDRTDWPLVNYQEGNYFIETPEDTVPAGYWDEVMHLNETATASQLLGFNMDMTPVENEVINCKNTWMKYYTDLRTGASDPETTLPLVIADLKKKGMDKIIAEAQRQIDEFYK